MPYKFNPLTGNLDYYKSNYIGENFGASTTTMRGPFDLYDSTTISDIPTGHITPTFGSGTFPDDGLSFSFYIYAYKTVGAVTIYSATPLILNYTDPGTFSQTYYFDIYWDVVADADGYIVLVMSDDYDGFYGGYYFNVTGSPQL